ncbi:hypothetical protein M5689_021404 [Euphorbia peplus]|nr:hypothetical protein M5689_021404 [Euphorbia peplus]
MGCSESKNEKEESLSRFKHRVHFVKQAISGHNALYAALSAYAICLKNTGAAFTDGFHPHFSHKPSSPSPPPTPPPPPPPPLLSFETLAYPFCHPVSMPEFILKPEVATIIEEESDSGAEELTRNSSRRRGDIWQSLQQVEEKRAIPGTGMHQGFAWDYFFPEEEILKKKVILPLRMRPPAVKKHVPEIARKSREPVSLMQIIGDLDNHFLKAFESMLEVSQMLDYQSNVPDNKQNEHIEEIETIASMLNKLLAWETKLYDELKVGEAIKYDYQKKVSLLNKQKIHHGSNPKSLENLKTSITHLHTRYLVETQSTVYAAAKIIHIRDQQLYPKLVQLIDGMAYMWKSLLLHHESQFKSVYSLKSLDNPEALNGSSKYQYNCTIQLCGAARVWHTQFCGFIEYQKNFVRALHRWSQLSLIPIETNLEKKMNSVMARNAPIHELLTAWKNDLDELPDEAARNEIRKFATVIQKIVHQQHKELKLRETSHAIPELREPAIISLKQQLEEGEEGSQTIPEPKKNKSLESLKHSLPEFFRALSEIAQACSTMYCNLRNIAENQNKGGKEEKKDATPTAVGETKDDGKPVSVYKMNMHCEGCVKKIIKFVKHLEGLEAVEVDLKANKLTVTGEVDPAKVKARLEEKAKRKVDIVSPQTTKNNTSGGKKPEEKAMQ